MKAFKLSSRDSKPEGFVFKPYSGPVPPIAPGKSCRLCLEVQAMLSRTRCCRYPTDFYAKSSRLGPTHIERSDCTFARLMMAYFYRASSCLYGNAGEAVRALAEGNSSLLQASRMTQNKHQHVREPAGIKASLAASRAQMARRTAHLQSGKMLRGQKISDRRAWKI